MYCVAMSNFHDHLQQHATRGNINICYILERLLSFLNFRMLLHRPSKFLAFKDELLKVRNVSACLFSPATRVHVLTCGANIIHAAFSTTKATGQSHPHFFKALQKVQFLNFIDYTKTLSDIETAATLIFVSLWERWWDWLGSTLALGRRRQRA